MTEPSHDPVEVAPTPDGGRWVYRSLRPHACPKPGEARRGDVWRCECTRRWLCVTSAEYSYSIAGGATWMRWSSWLPWPWPR